MIQIKLYSTRDAEKDLEGKNFTVLNGVELSIKKWESIRDATDDLLDEANTQCGLCLTCKEDDGACDCCPLKDECYICCSEHTDVVGSLETLRRDCNSLLRRLRRIREKEYRQSSET